MGPVVWGVAETKRQIVLYSVLLVAVTLMFGAVAQLGWIYFVTASAGGLGFVALALRLRRREGIAEALPLFFFSMAYLALLFGSMMADELLLR
jgi:protoheme IX farnesyltransferase